MIYTMKINIGSWNILATKNLFYNKGFSTYFDINLVNDMYDTQQNNVNNISKLLNIPTSAFVSKHKYNANVMADEYYRYKQLFYIINKYKLDVICIQEITKDMLMIFEKYFSNDYEFHYPKYNKTDTAIFISKIWKKKHVEKIQNYLEIQWNLNFLKFSLNQQDMI